eukprot:scaffold4359_cov106-Isochrysis_galbana.AAC.5
MASSIDVSTTSSLTNLRLYLDSPTASSSSSADAGRGVGKAEAAGVAEEASEAGVIVTAGGRSACGVAGERRGRPSSVAASTSGVWREALAPSLVPHSPSPAAQAAVGCSPRSISRSSACARGDMSAPSSRTCVSAGVWLPAGETPVGKVAGEAARPSMSIGCACGLLEPTKEDRLAARPSSASRAVMRGDMGTPPCSPQRSISSCNALARGDRVSEKTGLPSSTLAGPGATASSLSGPGCVSGPGSLPIGVSTKRVQPSLPTPASLSAAAPASTTAASAVGLQRGAIHCRGAHHLLGGGAREPSDRHGRHGCRIKNVLQQEPGGDVVEPPCRHMRNGDPQLARALSLDLHLSTRGCPLDPRRRTARRHHPVQPHLDALAWVGGPAHHHRAGVRRPEGAEHDGGGLEPHLRALEREVARHRREELLVLGSRLTHGQGERDPGDQLTTGGLGGALHRRGRYRGGEGCGGRRGGLGAALHTRQRYRRGLRGVFLH